MVYYETKYYGILNKLRNNKGWVVNKYFENGNLIKDVYFESPKAAKEWIRKDKLRHKKK